MTPLRACIHRTLVALTTALLLAASVASCHRNPSPTDRAGTPAERVENRGNTLERHEMTYAVTTMEDLLAHRIPGVVIRRSRGYAWVEIRGPGTISSSTEALIVIDGIENTSRGLLAMNPDDVQRIHVLKGASASIYGVRGANGVLVVTTRRSGQ